MYAQPLFLLHSARLYICVCVWLDSQNDPGPLMLMHVLLLFSHRKPSKHPMPWHMVSRTSGVIAGTVSGISGDDCCLWLWMCSLVSPQDLLCWCVMWQWGCEWGVRVRVTSVRVWVGCEGQSYVSEGVSGVWGSELHLWGCECGVRVRVTSVRVWVGCEGQSYVSEGVRVSM